MSRVGLENAAPASMRIGLTRNDRVASSPDRVAVVSTLSAARDVSIRLAVFELACVDVLAMTKKKPRTARSIRSYQRDIRALRWSVKRLQRELFGITSLTVPVTLERDMKAGETVDVRFPQKFVPW